MEILNNIWLALTTSNQVALNIITIPLTFVEAIVSTLLFTTFLNINASKKQKITYILFIAILGILTTFLIPKPFGNLITLVAIPFSTMFIFKISFLKGIFAELIPVICITILELVITRLTLIIFKVPYNTVVDIPIYRFVVTSAIYLCIFGLYKLIKHFNVNITILDSIDKKSKGIIIINLIFALIVIFMQMYLISFYNDRLPFFIILINLLCLLAYFSITIFNMAKTMKLEKATEDLEKEKLYNKTLQILHDNIRAFKHDFSNIIAGIGGYVETNDIKGLKKYYRQLLQDCKQVNNLSSLNPDTVNNPAVYAVLANKYYKADNLGIKISLESFIDFNKLHMEIYEFTRILGILMDNAIEASSECEKKLINVIIRNDPRQNRQLLIIENTYKNKDVNVEKIYEKGFTTKPNNTGLGLWEVNKIISKHKNLARYTTKTDEYFRQQIEIYNE